MQGIAEQFGRGGVLHQMPRVHDPHGVGDAGHHAQVVGDEEHGHAALAALLRDEAEDLALDGGVEGRGGFVRQQQVGLAGQGHGDHHALAHAAGKLVGVIVVTALCRGDAHLGEQADDLPPGLAAGQAQVQAQGLRGLHAHFQHRVERGHGLLEDHGDMAAPQGAHLFRGHGAQVAAAEQDAAADMGIFGQQMQDGAGREALAAAGFAHQAGDARRGQAEADGMDGGQDAVVRAETDGKLFQSEGVVQVHGLCGPRCWVGRPVPDWDTARRAGKGEGGFPCGSGSFPRMASGWRRLSA